MVYRKGISISIWIWVIVGIVIAAFVFASAQQNIQMLIIQLNNQQVVEHYNTLYNAVNSICSMTKGTKETKEISMNSNVYAIYVSEKEGPPIDSAPHYIENLNLSSGYHMCYQFQVEHDYDKYNCRKTACNVTMTYMGMPPKGSKLERIARLSGDSFNYKLNIVKEAKDNVRVTASPVLK
ncbi:MAG: hypothetical protein ABIG84_07430 [archaeon]